MIDDKSSPFIGEAFDKVLNTYFKSICLVENFIETDGYFRASSGFKNPNHNIFYQDLIPDNDVEQHIQETIEYFSGKNIPFTWWVSEESITQNVRDKLKSSKFRYYGDVKGLSINIEDIEKNFDTPNSLYTRQLTEESKFSEWTRIVAPAYGLRTDRTKELDQRFVENKSMNEKLPIKRYMSYLDGDPVSVSTTIDEMGVVGILDDEIVPYYAKYVPFRMSVLYYPLKEYQKAGFKVGIAFADIKRLNVYKMLGFDEVHQYHKFVFIPKRS